jgi:DNA-binding beta-propeller fold protein YncE
VSTPSRRLAPWIGAVCALLLALAVPAAAPAALIQPAGKAGCVVDQTARFKHGCTPVRALRGPGPFQGSNAVAVSPDGRNVYVASARSDAIAVFRRHKHTGRLVQGRGARGCIALAGAHGCATAQGLDRPNSVAVSRDGRSVYAPARDSDSVVGVARNRATGALRQIGCVSGSGAEGCARGRALDTADVVAVSPDGRNVYVGAFGADAVAAFARDRSTGAITQLAGTAGCIAAEGRDGCLTGRALTAPEGLAVSHDGGNVYAASAISGAVDVLIRDPTDGRLSQRVDGSGCLVTGDATDCTAARLLAGANAVALSPNDRSVYVTSLLSTSVTAFARFRPAGNLEQLVESFGCVVPKHKRDCAVSATVKAPEGVAVSPDGREIYVASIGSGTVDVLRRGPRSGGMFVPRRGQAACVAQGGRSGCARGRHLRGVASVAVSPDGRHVYATAFASNAVVTLRVR